MYILSPQSDVRWTAVFTGNASEDGANAKWVGLVPPATSWNAHRDAPPTDNATTAPASAIPATTENIAHWVGVKGNESGGKEGTIR